MDQTKSNGYAFIGDFVQGGQRGELPMGTFLLAYDTAGSQKNWYPVVRLWQLSGTGLELLDRYEGAVGETSWALAVRDKYAELLNPFVAPPVAAEEASAAPDLSAVPIATLLAEMERRGFTCTFEPQGSLF